MSLAAPIKNAITKAVVFDRARKTAPAPMASFSFDDFPRSAWTTGGPILDRHGAKATYYTAGRFCGIREDGLDYYTAEDLRAVKAGGHEIGSHSFSHQPAPRMSLRGLNEDLDRNQAFLQSVAGELELTSFAYPYGHVSLRAKRLAGRRFVVSRGYRWGLNKGAIDLGELRAVHLERRSWSAADIEKRVAEAARCGGWLVFVSHDVSSNPSPYGATPEMLGHALAAVRSAGFDVLTVSDALHRALGG